MKSFLKPLALNSRTPLSRKRTRRALAAFLCGAVCSVCLGGCKGSDPKSDTPQGGKGLSEAEKKDKRGE